MAGLVKIAAPPKSCAAHTRNCCVSEAGKTNVCFVRKADLGTNRSECLHSAQNDRPKTRPAVCIVFRYRLRLRKGRSLKNNNTLKIIYFLNAPF
jgi:hypothetical protein